MKNDRIEGNESVRRLASGFAAALCLAILCLGLDFFLSEPSVPSFAEVKARYRPSEAFLYDRHGELLHTVRIDMDQRRLGWTASERISPALKKAVVLAEDRRFFSHKGTDWVSVASAVYGRLSGKGGRGASTITMQLASQLRKDLRPRSARRTWLQKYRQMKTARALERSWTKDEILEAYLNLITYSGELRGISAASGGLFGKDPSGLDVNESIILSCMISSPGISPERSLRKASILGSSMGGTYDLQAIRAFLKGGVRRPCGIRPAIALAPHVARELLKNGVHEASCTLDRKIQEHTLDVLARTLTELKGRNVSDGAVLVADNATGDILAYVGNTGSESSARYVDGVRALRQAGSTLKPFLYGLAIGEKVLTASSIVLDGPLKIMTPSGIYQPEDYDRTYLGPVSLRTALASSLNTPAVRTLMLVGSDRFVERLHDLGFDNVSRDPDYYGHSLALGTVDISLYELVQAYMALGNNGVLRPLRLTAANSSASRQAMDPEAAYIISSILSDRESRSSTFGLENPLATRFWTAAKTGTSKDMRDNWCIGFSERYTVGVWVGNFDGSPMWNVTGITGAAPVWLEIMNFLHGAEPSREPAPPDNVVRQNIRFAISERPRAEYYISGTEPATEISQAVRGMRHAITYPVDNAVIAVDPDIPDANQAVWFQADPPSGSYRWMLNGRCVGTGRTVLWKPAAGRYRLSLADSGNTVLDSVSFVVK